MRHYTLLRTLILSAGSLLLMCGSVSAQQQTDNVKNVIYMIGDGMGLAQVTALMIDRDYTPIAMERATAVGLVKTYSANNRVTDSAAAGTALATGNKTDNSRLGIAPCGSELYSLGDLAGDLGWRRGIVVTVRAQHATPGAFYAHVYDRSSYDTIALQLLDSGIDVIMGGGARYLDPSQREDRRDLFEQARKAGYNVAATFEEAQQFRSGKLIALLSEKDMQYSQDGRADYLPEATALALEILNEDNQSGFFLMVEGSMIDYACHDGDIERVISETADFDRAVETAFDFADRNPGTLVVVTADHETGGLAISAMDSDYTAAESGLKYTFATDGHSASMVPLFAYGAAAHRFSQVLDNTEIPRIIMELMRGDSPGSSLKIRPVQGKATIVSPH